MTTVVSVHSFRGGTGKSNITANTAAKLAAAGHRVGIIDTDIQSPGIHVLFGFGDNLSDTLNDYLWGRESIDRAAHDVTSIVAASTPVKAGGMLCLVPSSMRPQEITRVLREGYDVVTLNEGFRDLARSLRLDYLFIDTHPGLNEETMLSITISDVLLLILRPDKQDFQGTAVTVDIARRLAVPSLLLVLNKIPDAIDTDDLLGQVDKAYGAQTVAALPLSQQVVLNASGGLFSLTHPDHPWSRQIDAIADALQR
ncbi:MAG: MinD/ParA family protein [Actinomycetes bacterium]